MELYTSSARVTSRRATSTHKQLLCVATNVDNGYFMDNGYPVPSVSPSIVSRDVSYDTYTIFSVY